MPLSRLDNFLKNVRGNIIYVDPNSLDATDNITNQGNSMARPFKTIQRALIEASRFSYQRGFDNDRFEKTTIMLAPGEHLIDNRPGWIPDGSVFRLRDGTTTTDFSQFDSFTDFDIANTNNALYKLNSIHGGVIVPRGVSIVGQDLRKCKIRPLYVPNPVNDDIERASIFKITGGTYFYSFTILDADQNSNIYKDYTATKFAPTFSHHKLTAFEYVDGVNDVKINDQFTTNYSTNRTDLDMYYEKIGIAYGPSSGRPITPDYPAVGVDIQAKVDEYRIVGPVSGSVGISSIQSGDGVTASSVVTAYLSAGISGLNADTVVQINDVTDTDYNGTYKVTEIVSIDNEGDVTAFRYEIPTIPADASPSSTGANIVLSTDTVSGASPYIFNVSMRSVYGLCGMHADGSKAAGFKSMVVAQFTGISLQIDDDAFVRYNTTSGSYDDSTTVDNIHSDPLAKYKPSYRNYHIKASNNAFIQLVSIFAIGFSDQFVVESGGDFSITNSNSNFGQTALRSDGFRETAFPQDDVGYITNIIPPEKNQSTEVNIEYGAIDVATTVGVGSTSRLYLYNQKNSDVKPPSVIQGYRIGAKYDDRLNVLILSGGSGNTYNARIVMPDTHKSANQVTSVKVAKVGRNVGTGNSITGNTLTFAQNHNFLNGETIRVLSDNTRIPDGLENNTVYYAITDGLSANQIKIAKTLNDALNGNAIAINKFGGTLTVESRVSDKVSGDIGHPIQFDSTANQWYVTVGTASSDNNLYPALVSLGTSALGEATSRTYVTRTPDSRSSDDRIYKFRYVIPAAAGIATARAPKDSFVVQESNKVIGDSNAEVALPYSPTPVTMSNEAQLRNFRFIADAKYAGGTVTIFTEKAHGLSIGSTVEIENVISTNNPIGVAQSGYNGVFRVSGITSSRGFTVAGVSTDPGTFSNNTSNRTTSLPTFKHKKSSNNFYIQNVEQIQEYVSGEQDGVYYLTILNSSNIPPVAPFTDSQYSFSQPIKNLYPQYDRDNPTSDPAPSISFAIPNGDKLGEVIVNDARDSITRESLQKFYTTSSNIGVGITNIVTNSVGTALTIHTDRDHGLNRITTVSIANAGSGYGNGTGGTENLYNAILSGSILGRSATARITVNSLGSITDVKIIDGGSCYVVGETLNVVGTATTTGFSQGTVTVTGIYNNVSDTLRVTGVRSDTYNEYNQLYNISAVPSSKTIRVSPSIAISGINTNGIGAVVTQNAYTYVTGKTLNISSFSYDNVSGLATVTTTQAHGFRVNNAVRISGATSDLYNNEFIVTNNVGLSTFVINVGVNTTSPATTGTLKAHYPGPTPQSGTIISSDDEFSGRQVEIYAGITTVISSPVTSRTIDEINIRNVTDYNFEIGDFIQIDDEIMRIKTTVTGNPVKVFRGLFGTIASVHEDESVVKRVAKKPIELRRNSIIRASGHTFEYIGYGPGNYSTAFPDKQTQQLDLSQQLRAQSFVTNSGTNVYTGMNDVGDFFIGNKKISSTTGREEVYDTPIQTITGEDITQGDIASNGIDVIEPLEGRFRRSIKVDGGFNGDILSEFNGPVVFNEKLTSTSDQGIEANSIYLQGDTRVSRNYTVGISTPVLAGNPGDVVYNANPVKGGSIGWTYTLDRGWYPFGSISVNQNSDEVIFDKVGVGTTSTGKCTFKVGSGTSIFCVDTDGVGIGTTANGYKLNVVGDSNISGILTATKLVGDGSGITNLSNDSRWFIDAGSGDVVPYDNRSVGVGTTNPTGNYTLEVGTTGAATTDLYVRNQSRFISKATFAGDATVNGTLSASNIKATGGQIQVGIITATTALRVGTSQTVFSATSRGVGIGLATPTEDFDVAGRAKFSAYYENVQPVTISSGTAIIDLSLGNSFQLNVTSAVNEFQILNPVSGSTFGFTLKIVQGGTAFGVGINTFIDSLSNAVQVYWPGGLTPDVTAVAGAEDIYSFMSFNGGTTLYGGIGGQNFSVGVAGTTPFDGWTYNSTTRTVTIHDNLTVTSNMTAGVSTFTTVNATTVNGATINSTSDINLKDNIQIIDNSLDKIIRIEGVNFSWKKTGEESAGVIAQNVEEVLPQLIANGSDGFKSVNYNGLVGVLIEAVKELKKEIDELKSNS